MNENRKDSADYVGYEYKELTTSAERASFYLDCLESFGWQPDEHFGQTLAGSSVTLHLRRDRKIMGKMELTRLQRNFEASMGQIDALERSKETTAQIAALSTGLIGTAFMAGSTFAFTATPPIIWLCVLLAIPGFIGWALPYFLYKRLVARRTKVVTPLIEQKYEEIDELCRKGHALLN